MALEEHFGDSGGEAEVSVNLEVGMCIEQVVVDTTGGGA